MHSHSVVYTETTVCFIYILKIYFHPLHTKCLKYRNEKKLHTVYVQHDKTH